MSNMNMNQCCDISIGVCTNFKGPKGDTGATGPQGEPGRDGADGLDGVSVTHRWDGTVLTITSAAGTSSADLRGPQGEAGSGAAADAVLFSAQALEDAQQAQARWNIGAASEEAVSLLMDEMDALHPLAITGFTVSPALAEKGSRVTAQTFAYGVNRTGAAVTLEGEAVSGGSAERSDVLTADRTYTLEAGLNGVKRTATAAIRFVAPVYFGTGADDTLSSATVLALERVLTTSRARTIRVSAGDGEYILYALPETLGVPTFKVGGFEGGFALAGLFDFTNASGHTQAYRLYRSVNTGLGETTVSVS